MVYNSYTRVCPPVRGDNPRALAGGLSHVQADKPWYGYYLLYFLIKSKCLLVYPVRLSHLEHSLDNGENYLDPSGVGLYVLFVCLTL